MKKKDVFIAYDLHGDNYVISIYIFLDNSKMAKIEMHLENGEQIVYVEKGVYKTNDGFVLQSNAPNAP